MKKLYFLLFVFVMHTAAAQKLPNLQTKPVPVPANIKIDGDDEEWNGTYAAFNKKLDVFYTLTNDDKNVYLIVKSKSDGLQLNKILSAGFQLSLNVDNEKQTEGSYRVAYPIQSVAPATQDQRSVTDVRNIIVSGVRVTSNVNSDSIRLASRVKQLANARELKVFGFPAIQDSVLSIYNEYNIKVASKFTETGDYIYEMAIPLNLMGLSADQPREITYQLRANPIVRINPGQISGVTVLNGTTVSLSGATFVSSSGGFNEMLLPTEVWGKFTLTKF